MNKIYKVLWSRVRQCHVVTDESKRQRVKGKTRSIVNQTATVLLASLLSAGLSFAPPVFAATAVSSTNIKVDSKWGKTTVRSVDNLHDIKTEYVVDGVGVNKFSNFELKAQHIANLHYAPGSSELVNFVNNQIRVDGTVNSVIDNKIGGHLIFVSPNGMTVGSTGVINAVSFTAIAPDKKTYDKLSQVGEEGGNLLNMNKEEVEKLSKGNVPLNPNAVISVSGNINAGNRISIYAGKIEVGAGANITNKVTDFWNLVNIKDGDSLITSSQLMADLRITPDTTSNSGDVLLLARQDTDTVSYVSASPEVSAEITVQGEVSSRENLTVKALAGNGSYKYDKADDEEHFSRTGNHNLATVNASVMVSGTGSLNAQKDLTVEAIAENCINDSGLIPIVEGVSLELLGSTTPLDQAVAFGDLKTRADVTINGNLTAGEKLTTRADADTQMVIGTSTSAIQLVDLINVDWVKEIPSAAVVVGLADSQASVNISGTLQSGGDLTIESTNNLDVSLTSTASTYNSENVRTAFVVGKLKGSSSVDIKKPAQIKISSSAPAEYKVIATQNNSVETSASAASQRNSYGGLSFNYTELNTSSKVNIETGLTGLAKNVVIHSENSTSKFNVSSDNATTSWPFLEKLSEAVSGLSLEFMNQLFNRVWGSFNSSYQSPSVRIGGAVAVITGSQEADLVLNPALSENGMNTITAKGNMDISSFAQIWDHHFVSNSGVDNSTDPSGKHANFEGSLALLVQTPGGDKKNTLTSNLTIGDDANLVVNAGNLVVTNEARIEWNRLEALEKDLSQAYEDLVTIYKKGENGQVSGFEEAWNRVEVEYAEMVEAFKEISNSDRSDSQKASQFGTALGEFFVTAYEFLRLAEPLVDTVKDLADVATSLWSFSQPASYVNASVSSSASGVKESLDAALSLAVLMQNTQSQLTIGKSAKLSANGTATSADDSELSGAVVVGSHSANESLALGGHIWSFYGIPLPNITDAKSAGGTLLYQSLGTDNSVLVREGAELSAQSTVGLYASDRIFSLGIGASSDVSKGEVAIDGLVSLGSFSGKNAISFDDEATMKGFDVVIDASRNDNIQTIAGAIDVSMGDSASTAAGVGIAVNWGSLDNTLSIENNDKLSDDDEDKLSLTKGAGLNAVGGKVSIIADQDLAINAIGAAGVASSSGQNDPKPHGPTVTKVLEFLNQAGGGLNQFGESLKENFQTLANSLQTRAGQWGSSIRQTLFKVGNQNNAASNVMNGQGQNNDDRFGGLGRGGDAALDGGIGQQNDAANANQAKNFQLALAGSVAWNKIDTQNSISIDVNHFTIDAPTVDINAVTDKWIGAWAGSAGLSFVGQHNNVSDNMSIGGAVAGNTGTLRTVVDINGDFGSNGNNTGLVFGPAVADINIYAINDGTLIAEGLSAAVATGVSENGNWAFDANVSVNWMDTTTSTEVKGIQVGAIPQFSYDQAAWIGDSQVTGGTGFGLTTATGEGRNGSLGLIFALADLDNTVTSTLENATMDEAKAVDVRALSSLTQVTTAISAQAALGDSAVAFTGSAASADLENIIKASLSRSKVSLSGTDARLQVASRDSTTDEHEIFNAITEQNWYPEAASELSNTSFYEEVGLISDKGENSDQAAETITDIADFLDNSNMVQTSVVLSLGIAPGSSSGAAGVLVNRVNNQFSSFSEDVTVSKSSDAKDSKFLQSSEAKVVSVGVVAGAAGSGSADQRQFSAAGSVLVSNIDQVSHTETTGLTSEVDSVMLQAGNAATTVNVAGNVGVSMGNSSAALGGAIVVMNTDNQADVVANEVSLTGGIFNARSENRASSWAAAADGAVSGNMAFGGAVAVNRVKNTATIALNNVTLENVADVVLHATDNSALWTLAGNVAVGAGENGAGVSGAVAYSISGREDSPGTEVNVDHLTIKNVDAKTNLDVYAKGQDRVSTLVISAGVGTGSVGLAGAAGVNEIKRHVTASVSNLENISSESDSEGSANEPTLGKVSIIAQEDADIDNLGLVASYGSNVAGGLGVAVNRINNVTNALLTSEKEGRPVGEMDFAASSLRVEALTDNDIDTIAIGGAASQNVAASGSIALNLITSDTLTTIKNVAGSVNAFGIVNAQSDDTIGSYTGEAAGAQSAAIGLSVTVNEKKGETSALVEKSMITHTGTENETGKVKAGISDDEINDQIVNQIDVGATLADKRSEKDIKGLFVGSTSTETFKNFVINGGGAGTAAVNGTTSVAYSGGSTLTTVNDSSLKSNSDIDLFAADYSNFDTVSITGGGAGTAAVPISVNIVTADHMTEADVSNSSLDAQSAVVNLKAEGKEGVSALAINAAGAGSVAAGVLVNITRELSDVSVIADEANVQAATYTQSAGYLGRITTLGLNGEGAGDAGGSVSVSVNYADNDIKNLLSGSTIFASKAVNVTSRHDSDWHFVDTSISGALYGALGTYVAVNTIEGLTQTKIDNQSAISGKDDEVPDVTVKAENVDHYDATDVLVSGAGFGDVGATIIVNRFLGDANISLNASDITAKNLTIKAVQDHFINQTSVSASGAIGAVGANVLVSIVGNAVESDFWQQSDMQNVDALLTGYMQEYGGASSQENPGVLANVFDAGEDYLTDEDEASLVQAAEVGVSVDAASRTSGTAVAVKKSGITAQTFSITAEEDKATNAGLSSIVGQGNLGGGVLAASVATLRRNHNAVVNFSASNLESTQGGTIGAYIGGTNKLEVWQVDGALASGTAAYGDARINGQAWVRDEGTTFNISNAEYSLKVEARNDSQTSVISNGISVGGITGGGMVADLRDATSVCVDLLNSVAYGNLTVEAIRSQVLNAEAMAGQGGLINGAGGLASITDSGSVKVTLDAFKHSKRKVSDENDEEVIVFNLKANDQTQSTVYGYGALASGLGVGVVQATIDKSGSTDVSVNNSAFESSKVNFVAAAGIESLEDKEALRLTAVTDSYGGAIVGALLYNLASINNQYAVNLKLTGGDYAQAGALDVRGIAHGVYNATANTGSGGVISTGNNMARVTHAMNVNTVIDNIGRVESLSARSVNTDYSTVESFGAGGGILLVEGPQEGISPAYSEHTNTAQTQVTVMGNLVTNGDLTLIAQNVINGRFKADNTKGGLAGGSGANLTNSNTTVASAIFDKTSQVISNGQVNARALTSSDIQSSDGYYAVDSGVYGGFMGSEIALNNTENNINKVEVKDEAVLTSAGDLTLEAKLTRTTDLRTRARTAGVVNGANAHNTHSIASANTLEIGKAQVKTIGSGSNLIFATSAEEKIHAEAIGDLQGALAGGAGARVNLNFVRDNAVNVVSGADVQSSGEAKLYAGRDASGKNAALNLTSYAHAYGKGLISGTEVTLNNPMTLKNNINVMGSVQSRNNIDAVASSGEVKTTEMARYYHWSTNDQAADKYEIASTATGTKSGSLTEENAVTVDGKLIAGFATSSDITIDGIYLPEDENFIISAEGEKLSVTQEGEKATIEYGSEDQANVYWSRHEEIQRLLAEYGAQSDEETRQMMVALKAEDAYLLQLMEERGFASKADGKWQLIGSQERGFIAIKNLELSGGNIAFTTDEVKGGADGVIEAHSADHINITNHSNLVLHLENVFIDEKGGNVTLNDLVATSFTGFTGQLISEANSSDPTMNITSQYIGSLTVTGTHNGKTETRTLVPDTSLVINGLVGNCAGNVEFDITGDITINSGATVTAAGDLRMGATGSVMQAYSEGIFNVSGDGSVESLWDDVTDTVRDKWKADYVDSNGTSSINSWTYDDSAPRVNEGEIVAGGDIFIAGQVINLNGTVQSGFADYELSITDTELNEKVKAIAEAWKSAGSPETIDVKTQTYQISQGGYELKNGQYVWKVGAWYDPVNDRVIIDDITPEGGHIYLTGKIASTGGGKLLVVDGQATVNVDAGEHELLTGNISTGNRVGLISISDMNYSDDQVEARITEYTKDENGQLITKTYNLLTDGKYGSETIVEGKWVSYKPQEGQLYAWSEGFGTTTVETKSDSQDFYLWGGIDKDPTTWETTHTEVKENQALSSAGTIGKLEHEEVGDHEFVAWGDKKDITQSEWDVRTWTKYHDFLHFSGTNYGEATQTKTNNYLITYTVKADKAVSVEAILGDNSISLASDKSVLLGGRIEAIDGTIHIDAGTDILNHSGTAVLYGASAVTLNAGGSIGTDVSAIKIAQSGDLKLTATAGNNLFLDASSIKQGADVTADLLNAKGDLNVLSRGTLNVTGSVKGTNMALVSFEGDLTLASVEQFANADGTQRFDAQANKVAITSTASDLAVGVIEAKDSVNITTSYALTDAQDRSEEDTATAEEKINAWKQAGLIAEDGSDNARSRYEADINAARTEIAQQLEMYQGFLDLTEKEKEALSQTQYDYYESLGSRFEGYGEVSTLTVDKIVEADKANADTRIGAIEEAFNAGDYGWSQNELLFAVADSIINPDPGGTPSAGKPNIVAKTITIDSKAVGVSDGVLSGSFADFDVTSEKGLKLYQALSRADIDDVVWDFENQTVSVQTTRPMIVSQTTDDASLNVTADENIFIQSTDETALHIGKVQSDSGPVRLISANGIYGTTADNLVKGVTVTLRGGAGGIGTVDQAINIAQATGGWTALSASKGIYVNSDDDVILYSVATDTGLYLTAKSVGSYTGEPDEDETEFDTNDLGYINSPNVRLTVAENGSIGSENVALRVDADASVTLSPQGEETPIGNVNLQTVNEGTLKLSGFISSGWVKIASDSLNATDGIVASDSLTLSAEKAMSVRSLMSETDSIIAKAGTALNIEDGSTLSAIMGYLKLSGNPLNFGKQLTLEALGLDIDTEGNLTFVDSELSATGNDGLSLKAGGILRLENSTLNSKGITYLSGEQGVNVLKQSKIESDEGSELTIISEQGDVLLAGFEQQILSGSGIDIKAGGHLDASSLTLSSGSNIVLSSQTQTLNDTTFTGLVVGSALAGDLTLKALSGALDLTTAEGFEAKNINIQAQRDVTFKDGEKVIGAESVNVESSDGSVILKNGQLSAEGLISLAARGGTLNLTGTNNNQDDFMVLTSDRVTLVAQGKLAVGNTPIKWIARTGDLSVEAESLNLATGSSVSAEGAVEIHSAKRLVTGDNFSAIGATVDLTGGEETFTLGNGSSFTSKAGGINVLGDGDATLGGSISVNATAQNSEDTAKVTIGAQGIFSVTDNDFTVVAKKGAVEIWGGKGMQILDDLMVVTDQDATIRTDSGNLEIGNKATVKAGTAAQMDPETADGTYGVIDILAGENLTIGDEAVIYANNLDVRAQKDVTFGSNADLWSLTDGIKVISETGSIHMGEDLVVHTNYDQALFEAREGDIVIERAGSLTSSGSSIQFVAGGNIVFKDNFRAEGLSFVLNAGDSVTVWDDAYVHTDFGDEPGEDNETRIIAGKDIHFGDNARFETTDLIIEAGASYENANLSFGDNARVITSHYGIVANATGDIIFGKGALLNASGSTNDNEVELATTGGVIFMDDGAQIKGKYRVFVRADQGITMGENADIVNISTSSNENSETLVQTYHGNIVLGKNSSITGQNVNLWATDELGTQGGSVILGDGAAIEVNSQTGSFNLRAYDSIDVQKEFIVESKEFVGFETKVGDITLGDHSALITAAALSLTSGRDINIGDNAIIVTSLVDEKMGRNDIVMNAHNGINFGSDTIMMSDASIYLTAQSGDVKFNQGATVGVSGDITDDNGIFSVESEFGSVKVDDDVELYGQQELSVKAADDIRLDGTIWLDSDSLISLTASRGDIVMLKDVHLGGFNDDGVPTEKLILTAGGSILQSEIGTEQMGLNAQNLVVIADRDVSLGVLTGSEGHGGNFVSNAEINAGGNVVLAFSQRDTELSVNADTSGKKSLICGDFVLIGQDNRLHLLEEDIIASGEVGIKALELGGLKNISADGNVQVYLTGNDDLVLNNVEGRFVGLAADGGAISVGSVQSDLSTEIIRTETGKTTFVGVQSVNSGGRTFVVNGAGTVSAGNIVAEDEIWVFAPNSSDIERGVWRSMNSEASAFSASRQLLRYISQYTGYTEAEHLRGRRFVPTVDFTMWDLMGINKDIHHNVIHERMDVINPLGRYFFLRRRTENADESGLAEGKEPEINNDWAEGFVFEQKERLSLIP